MEKEMRALGLSCPKDSKDQKMKNIKTCSQNAVESSGLIKPITPAIVSGMDSQSPSRKQSFEIKPLNETNNSENNVPSPPESPIYRSLTRQRSSITNKSIDCSSPDYHGVELAGSDSSKSEYSNTGAIKKHVSWMGSVTPLRTDTNATNHKIDKRFARKGNSLTHEPLHYKPQIRKYSLGNQTVFYNNPLAKCRDLSSFSSDPSASIKNSLSNVSLNSDINLYKSLDLL